MEPLGRRRASIESEEVDRLPSQQRGVLVRVRVRRDQEVVENRVRS